MKIFNEENGVKKIYVQLNDIARLIHSVGLIPASIMQRFFCDIFIVTDENRWEFEEFTDSRELEFFQNLDWIIDYRFYKNMTEKELIDHGTMVANEMDEFSKEYNANIETGTDEYLEDLKCKYKDLEHKMYSIRDLLWFKQGYRTMPFPEVADYEGFVLSGNNKDFPYVARQGLNPFQFIISKKDGAPLKGNEKIPVGFLQSTHSLSISENMEHNEFFGEFESFNKLSEDGTRFITTYRIITPEEKEKREKQAIKDEEKLIGYKADEKKISLSKRIANKFKNIFNK